MRDVAAKAKVSVATVSICLRGLPRVSAETTARVRRIAAELGYRPHPLVSALMRSRRKRSGASRAGPALAFVTAFPIADAWRTSASPLIRLLLEGATARATMRGYGLSHYWLYRDGMTNQRFSAMLRARGVRGIFLAPVPQFGMKIDLDWRNFSVVAHGLSIATPVFHRTTNDHYQSMMLAMRQCQRHGYHRPGMAMDAALSQRLEYRWETAFATERERWKCDRSVRSLFFSQWDRDEFRTWVRRERPDVVIGLFMPEHYAEILELGLAVPAELGLVSLSVHEPGSQISGIHQNARRLGEIAIDKLIDQVERNETGIPDVPITLTLEGRWHPGQTVRPSPADEGLYHAI